jgi:hypothetical protein
VYSLDHGHFFPSGPHWSAATLMGAGAATVDGYFGPVNLSREELAEARLRLESVSEADIHEILAGPPPEWPFPAGERDALQRYLLGRRATLLGLLPQ